MKNSIGVDPGKTGGIAFVNSEILQTYVMPLDSEREFSIPRIKNIFEVFKSKGDCVCYIEKSQPFSGQGISSTFNYATGYGMLLGIIGSLGIETVKVAPQTWQSFLIPKEMKKEIEDSKERARIVASRIFGEHNFLSTSRSTKPHEGLVDAALIAEYGYRKINNMEKTK